MDTKTISILEFDKIQEKLSSFAVSEQAAQMAHNLLPETDSHKVQSLLCETTDAVNMICRCSSPSLYGITSIEGVLKRAQIGSVLHGKDILAVGRVLQSARILKSYAASDKHEGETTLQSYFQSLLPDKVFEDQIFGNFLGEDEIADHASPELAAVRRQIRNAADKVKDILNDMIRSSKYQKYLQEPIITMRSGRNVVPVRAEYRGEVSGIIHDTSASGATLFIEPMSVVQENNKLRELEGREAEEIERILREYTEQIGARSDMIRQNYELIVMLDFIFAKAKMSLEMNATEPVLGEQVHLKKARHPLLDQRRVVPVDVTLGGEFDALIITGPNTGGKTVVLKTIGLFTLMAQAGLHIPAQENSVIKVYEKIFADIGDEQSIEQSLSTFSSHMKNIVHIMDQVDSSSLVLFDELGAGTDPVEGAALAIAIIENARAFGAQIAATTHYSELKLYALTTNRVKNASCEFDVETLQPTYKLLIGVPGKSNAFAISQKLGLPEAIVSKAKQRLSEDTIQFEDVLSDLEKKKREAAREAEEAKRLRREISLIKKTLKSEQDKISSKTDTALEKARQQAQQILLDAKRQSEEILDEVKELRKKAGRENVQKELVEVKTKLNQNLDAVRKVSQMPVRKKADPKKLKVGSTVELIGLGQKGTVLSLPKSDGNALVQVGLMKMNLPVSELALTDEAEDKRPQAYIKNRNVKLNTQPISSELDLRGLVLDDARLLTEKFIDDAVLASLKEVTIIHGKGTGALRTGIHQLLKSDKRVASFRLGSYGEGDSGVTICELE